jgi:ArsR family transcriptional regulator
MDLARILKALADPMRLRILAAITEEELTVGEVQVIVRSVQSSVSRNLAILRDAGLIRDRKEGTNVYFSLRSDMSEPIKGLYQSLRPRFSELPEAKADGARLGECRRRRIDRSRNYFEAIAGDWERIRKSYFDDRVTSLAIEKLLPSNLTLADIGCGTGTLAFDLARFAGRVIAVDLSHAMIRQARRSAEEKQARNIDFILGHAEHLPLEDGKVDAAFCVMVLHFVERPAEAIRELCRITRPGGSVILLDLVPHTQEWMTEQTQHRWLGFERGPVETWLSDAGACKVEYEPTGSYAGAQSEKNGKHPVEIFVARAVVAASPVAAAHRKEP